MHLKLITPPASEPITLDEARKHLRLDATGSPPSNPDDDIVTSLIAAVRQHCDGKDGWLGRALMTQTYDLLLDGGFPGDDLYHYLYRGRRPFRVNGPRADNAISIPLPPLQTVASIQYVDTDGVLQTLDTADYNVYQAMEPAHIVPAYGKCWPATRCQPEAVKIRFTAGYGDDADDVPVPIKRAMLLLISHWYENREIVMTGATMQEFPQSVDALLFPYRILWF